MATATAAAAVGGVTTVVDMPLNSNPVTTVASQLLLKQKLAKVGGSSSRKPVSVRNCTLIET